MRKGYQAIVPVFSALLLAQSALAAPLEPLVESFAGRFFLTETEEGAQIAERAIGHRIQSQEEYLRFLNRAKSNRLGVSDSRILEDRVGQLNRRIRSPWASDDTLFSNATGAARDSGLRLIHPEAEFGNVEFFPSASRRGILGRIRGVFRSLRDAFLSGDTSGMDTDNGSGRGTDESPGAPADDPAANPATEAPVAPAPAPVPDAVDASPSGSPTIETALQRSLQRMDSRAAEWVQNRQCISCHTVHPLVIARSGVTDVDQSSLDLLKGVIERRLADWDLIQPWYHSSPDQVARSRASELILSLSALTRTGGEPSARIGEALEKLVALQGADGSFPWLDFNLQPWESTEGKIYGNATALDAFSRVPAELQAQHQEAIGRLRGFLTAQAQLPSTSLWNKMAILGADTRSPGILTAEKRMEIIRSLLSLQHADGGWSLNRLGSWIKRGGRPVALATASDGYATAYSLYTLRQSGLLAAAEWDAVRPAWDKGVQWLIANQSAEGIWESASLNRDNPFSHGLIGDAATGYGAAVLREARTGH